MGTTIHEISTRQDLDRWLGGNGAPAGARPLVMILRGSTDAVVAFSSKALKRAGASETRELVWMKEASLFTVEEVRTHFKDRPDMLAVVLDRNGVPKAWVDASNASTGGAERAYLAAGVEE